MRVYSHSYWLAILSTTYSSRVLARERWQTLENSWKKTQYLMNTLYIHRLLTENIEDLMIQIINLMLDCISNQPDNTLLSEAVALY